MKTKQLLIFTLSLMGITFVSCNKVDRTFDVQGDIYFLTKFIDNQPHIGTFYAFYGNQGIDSVVVDLPGSGEPLHLENSSGSANFIFEPDESDYVSVPATGTYNFEVYSRNGEIYSGFDTQLYDGLIGAELSKIEYNSADDAFDIEWNKISDSDGYSIRIINDSGELMYYSDIIDYETTKLSIGQTYSSGFWEDIPLNGENYTLIFQTFLLDADASPADLAYNIQEVFVNEYPIVWGTN